MTGRWITCCCLGLVGCVLEAPPNAPIHAKAPPAVVNVVASRDETATVSLVSFAVPQSACSRRPGLKPFCIDNLGPVLLAGTQDVLERNYRTVSAGASTYRAEFTFVDLSHSPTSAADHVGGTVQVAMRWHFALRDASGRAVVELAETTVGPEQIVRVESADSVSGALLNSVLERLGQSIAAARGSAPTGPAVQHCVPGITQACLGPAACKGAQSCLPSGGGFGPCDCGSPAK